MKNQYLLSILEKTNPDFIGTKGKNLQVLCRQGFSVPLTFCLVSDAYRRFMITDERTTDVMKLANNNQMAPGEKSLAIIDIINNAPLPDDIRAEILKNDIISEASTKWAVRSSSNKEDMRDLSFAGLYESYLNIQGAESVIGAAKKCWASLWGERALIYREKHGISHSDASMSVLIQAMVDARYSGVIFTRDPNNLEDDGMIVEYTEGLGDRLMAGQADPCTCRIEGNTMTVSYLPGTKGRVFEDSRLVELCHVASDIESLFGAPQDIEWAYDGEKFFILQARPITKTIRPSQVGFDKLWTRANIGEVLPGIVTPLTWSVFSAILLGNPLFSSGEDLPESAGIRLIKGRAYIRVDSFLNSFCYLPFVTPQTIEKVLGLGLTSYTGSYKRPKGVFVRLAQGFFFLNLTGIIPYLTTRAKKMLPLKKAGNEGLKELLQWNARCFKLHILCTAYAVGAFAAMSGYLNRLLPSRADHVLPLILIGYEDLQTAAQGRNLSKLALHVPRHPALQKLVEEEIEWSEMRKQLEAVDGGPRFLSMIENFLEANGARTAEEFELALPRWRENPSFVLAVIGKFLEARASNFEITDWHDRQKRQEEAVRSVINALPIFGRLIFKRLLGAYRGFATLRENMKYRLMEGYEEIRKVFLKRGDELKSRSFLVDERDIFFLNSAEIDACLKGEIAVDTINHLILNRKENYTRLKKEQVRDFIMDIGGGLEEPENQVSDENTLTGVGCSPGVAEGSARILHDISEANLLKAGEILITPHTDPGWTPLFLTCKAVVTEIGGFLSHGATVAREYGIPAVVNVKGVTQKIRTGDLIRVDGTEGSITIIESVAQFKTRGL